MGSLIDIGIFGTENFVQIDYNHQNLAIIQQALTQGFQTLEVKSTPLLQKLLTAGLLTEFQNCVECPISMRHKNFMDFLGINNEKISEGIQKKILVFGAGAAGATITYLLAQYGYQHIYLIDDDCVEISDIEKTLIYKKGDIGKLKIDVLSMYLLENFGLNIVTKCCSPISKDELLRLINSIQPDLIIKACDPDLSFRYYLNEICFLKSIPFVYMSYSYERINIGPFFVPGLTGSDIDLENNFRQICGPQYNYLNHKKIYPNLLIHPSTSFNINILGGIILKEIIFFHLNHYEYVFSLNREVFFFPLSMRILYRSIIQQKL